MNQNLALAKPIRVLHVDDDSSFLEISKEILQTENNFEVDHALSVDEAFQKLKGGVYDVVVADYEMPKKDGLYFLGELKKSKDIPFILFTGKGREEVAIKALNLGADYYLNKQGSPQTVYGELAHAIRLLAERAKTRYELAWQRDILESVTANVGAGLAIIDKNYRIVWANRLMENIVGSPVAGKLCYSTFNNLDDVCPDCGVKKVLEGALFDSHVFQTVDKDGNPVWVELIVTPIKDESGKVTSALELAVNITERKKAEELLKNSYARLEAIVSNAPIGIATTSPDFKILSANESFCRITGYSEDELKKLSFKDFVHPDDVNESISNMSKLASGAVPFFSQERRHIRKDGSVRYGKVVVSAIRDSEGKPVLYVAELDDITEQKETQALIEKEIALKTTLLDNLPCIALILKKETREIVASNKMAREIGAVAGKYCYKVCAERDLPCPFCRAPQLWETNEPQQLEVTYKGKYYQGIWVPYNDELYVHYIFDITEQKLTQEEINQVKQRLEAHILNSPLAEIEFTSDYKIIRWSKEAERMFGWQSNEVLGKNISELNIVYLEDLQKVRQIIVDMLTGKCQSGVHSNRNYRKDGTVIYCEWYNSVVYDSNGKTLSIFSRVIDLTERKKLEDKLAVLSGFISHDIGNKIFNIKTALNLTKKLAEDKPELTQRLNKIEDALDKIQRILDASKIYEQIGSHALEPINVGKAVNDAASLFSDLKSVKIINKVEDLTVNADSLLTTIFNNLIDNSLKHGKTVTTIKVSHQQSTDGAENIIYEDDGVGIKPADKEKLFAKGFGQGAGYGLYLIKRACELYGWTITEEGTPNKGAKFTIRIPPSRNL
ncbi:MAG: PAS domain S-box protein [Candidatus Bathyarchaeia archaeon]